LQHLIGAKSFLAARSKPRGQSRPIEIENIYLAGQRVHLG
jgi:hypothetical protein